MMFETLRPLSYDLIMADPPWQFETYSDAGRGKSADQHYATMSLTDIKQMPVSYLGRGDCLLWLWATHPMLREGLDVMDAWGFRYVTSGVWVKRTKTGKLAFGTGYRLRCASEPFLIGTLGNPKTAKTVRTVIEGPVREHSRKPDEAYREAEAMGSGALRRLDMFSRETRPGWDAWGNEAAKFDEAPT